MMSKLLKSRSFCILIAVIAFAGLLSVLVTWIFICLVALEYSYANIEVSTFSQNMIAVVVLASMWTGYIAMMYLNSRIISAIGRYRKKLLSLEEKQ